MAHFRHIKRKNTLKSPYLNNRLYPAFFGRNFSLGDQKNALVRQVQRLLMGKMAHFRHIKRKNTLNSPYLYNRLYPAFFFVEISSLGHKRKCPATSTKDFL
jgi:hypothetical protein